MKKITRPSAPADEEYEFSRLTDKDGEFRADLPVACWWEYLRESVRARAAVAEYRKDGNSGLLPAELEPVRNITGTSLLIALSTVSDFPSTPWLSLPAPAREAAHAVVDHYGLTPAAWITADGFCALQNEIESTKRPGVFTVTLPILGGSNRARGASRRSVLMTVNWTANDEQIADAVRDWLIKNRPKDCANPHRRPRLSGGNLRFPAQYADALRWLTPLRLYHAIGSWKSVAAEVTPAKTRQDRLERLNNARKQFDLDRQGAAGQLAEESERLAGEAEKERARKAREIIDWLDGKKPRPVFE